MKENKQREKLWGKVRQTQNRYRGKGTKGGTEKERDRERQSE